MPDPATLNALPGWAGVAFCFFWIIKTLVDLLKAKAEGGKSDKGEESHKPHQQTTGERLARLEVRVDHQEAQLERMDDRLVDISREVAVATSRGDR